LKRITICAIDWTIWTILANFDVQYKAEATGFWTLLQPR